MSKQADRYFMVEPWRVVERGFDPAHAEVAESIFSLGNEFMGLRGYFEEGYSGDRLEGSYVGGVYERVALPPAHYKSMLPFIELMVNTVDWLCLPIQANGVPLDLCTAKIENFERALDLKTGVLTRQFIWHVDAKTRAKLSFERFLSMPRFHLGGQRLCVEALSGDIALTLTPSLDFTQIHHSTGQNHWHCGRQSASDSALQILGTTQTTKQSLFVAASLRGVAGAKPFAEDKLVGARLNRVLKEGQATTFERLITLLAGRDYRDDTAFTSACDNVVSSLPSLDYDEVKQESSAWWDRQWLASDIEIDGDPENQQGIRYSIFQLHQTLHTADRSAIIGAKGLTGEAYSGNAFWDSEVYCLPFYLLNNPRAALNILQFRYDTLPQAKERAKALDLGGAFYPIATISGHECCNLWQHANLQLQASTGVAYGIWHYVRVTNDTDFLYRQGVEMLVEICRMLATRGEYSEKTGQFGYYCVMGPDEFQMMVNNNAYTNFMAKRAFEYTLKVLCDMRAARGKEYEDFLARVALTGVETDDWRRKANDMRICYDEKRKLFEQHDGFFDLPHVDVANIPIEDFPLYDHWAYDRLYRNDMIKQPDVLMFMLLYNSSFTDEQLKANFDYYETRCIHESSLSPSVHSILAAQLKRMNQAVDFFGFATRLDLDNYNRNTREGLHTTAIAASWMNIVYGFGGLRTDGEQLSLAPSIPEGWTRYAFRIQYKGAAISFEIAKDSVRVVADREASFDILLYGNPLRPGVEPLVIPLVSDKATCGKSF